MQEWSRDHSEKSISIIQPAVIFEEENRKNVYSLFKQIVSGKFLMVGKGENEKSMVPLRSVKNAEPALQSTTMIKLRRVNLQRS